MSFKECRERAGLKQSEVSKYLNLTQSAVSLWEIGENFPKVDLLPRIARLYGCTIEDLLKNETQNGE